MQINKLIVLNIALATGLVGVVVHQKYFQSDEITGSRWACATFEEDFITRVMKTSVTVLSWCLARIETCTFSRKDPC